jgi:1,4-dihydroxy-6-naphthoate synthase
MHTTPFGYSPCPNDTFMFYAWSQAKIASQLAIEPRLADIQELNLQALGQRALPFTKISAALYPRIKSDYAILSTGAALGIGCGPLIVGPDSGRPLSGRKLAHPGIHTTAYQLARMALGTDPEQLIEMRYDEILPAVLRGEVGAGVIIHESRFVYQGLGLSCLLDLGNWWEKKTSLPLPLGIMVAKRDIADPVLREAEHSLQRSIDFAWQNSDQAWGYIKEHAIEIDDSTIRSHIELYVNSWSRDLGSKGNEALQAFFELCA